MVHFDKITLKLTRLGTKLVTLLAILPVASIAVTSANAANELIRIDGSSTVFPISEALAEEYQYANPGERVVVGVSGTGGGFKKFCRGETSISNASRPITAAEIEACAANGIEFIEVPIALDAIAIVVNPQNDWARSLTIAQLKAMWEPAAQNTIMNWNQIDPTFPDRRLRLFGPGVDSGTYDYFTSVVVGKEHSSRGDYTASENDNVIVQGVSGDANALGFFGLAYYNENRRRLNAVAISYNGADPVLPSVESASNASYKPFARPIFIYVNKSDYNNIESVRMFVDYSFDHEIASELVIEVGYVPLSAKLYDVALERIKAGVAGSVLRTKGNREASLVEKFSF